MGNICMYDPIDTISGIRLTDNETRILIGFRDKYDGIDDILIWSKLDFVKKIAFKYMFLYPNEFDDIVQEGLLAIYQAIARFDLSGNIKFNTYALMCAESKIKAYLIYLTSSRGGITIPHNLACTVARMYRDFVRTDEENIVKYALRWGKNNDQGTTYINAINAMYCLTANSFSDILMDDFDEEFAISYSDNYSNLYFDDTLAKSLRALNERELDVFLMKYIDRCTLREIGEKYGVSKERIRILILETKDKLKKNYKRFGGLNG